MKTEVKIATALWKVTKELEYFFFIPETLILEINYVCITYTFMNCYKDYHFSMLWQSGLILTLKCNIT